MISAIPRNFRLFDCSAKPFFQRLYEECKIRFHPDDLDALWESYLFTGSHSNRLNPQTVQKVIRIFTYLFGTEAYLEYI